MIAPILLFNFNRGGFFFLTLLIFSATSLLGNGNDPDPANCPDCFSSELISTSHTDDGCTVYTLEVTNDGNCRHALSHYSVDVPCGKVSNISNSENWRVEIGADPGAVLLVIDEDGIDNGLQPNDFSDVDVNDQMAEIGLRLPLRYFKENIGKKIDLFTGQVGDEGFFALKTIPSSWQNAGSTSDGVQNFLSPGPGLGAPQPDGDREALLDKIPDVTPLRATALSMLIGKTVLAVVYDSDISINYSPLQGNLMGANLGIVAFEVLKIGILIKTAKELELHVVG